MTSHSSRVRELKKSKSGGKMVNSEDENRAPISKTESEKNNEKLVDEDLTKYSVNELRDKLKVATSSSHASIFFFRGCRRSDGNHLLFVEYRLQNCEP